MRTPTQPVAMETNFGTLHVVVAPADEHSYHDMKRGNVTEIRPVLWVSTDPEFLDNFSEGGWKIRGRIYGVHMHLYYQDRSHLIGADGTPMAEWHRSGYQPYGGEFRNDRGGKVEFHTKTYEQMWDAVLGALATFVGEYPDWEAVSRYLEWDGKVGRGLTMAEDLRRKANEYEAAAAADADRRDAERAAISDKMMGILDS